VAQIAEAFVRIRPNMTGFKSETESGVRSAFSGVAKIVGVALGAGAAFEFGKGIITDAAQLQKSVETVNAEFGRGAAQVHQFADEAGIGFGIASHASEATAARFGILFKNLGVGQRQAATMTVGLLKLAGSLSAIRGVDPASVLDRLPLAVAGNLRSLKQLGVAVDANQIKLAAFKLGLISSVKDAITPAVRAQAIYSLATANLGTFLAQAKAHAGDFVNVQRRLSAEWDRAKELLGTALLPAFTKIIASLERWFEGLQKSGRLQRDFNQIASTTVFVVKTLVTGLQLAFRAFSILSSAVGGTKTLVVALIAAWSASKLAPTVKAIGTDLVGAFQKVRLQIGLAKLEYASGTSAMRLATVALGATIRGVLTSVFAVAWPLAIGFAVSFIITHWKTIKDVTVALAKGIVGTWQGIQTSLLGIGQIIAGALGTALTSPLVALANTASAAFGWVPGIGGALNRAADAVNRFAGSVGVGLVQKGFANVARGGAQIGQGFSKGFDAAVAATVRDPSKNAARRQLGASLGQAISDGATTVAAAGAPKVAKAVGNATQAAIAAAQQRIAQSVERAKSNLDSIGQKLAATIDKIQQKLGGVGGALAGTPQAQAFAKLKDLIASGAPDFSIARASKALSSQLQNVGKTQAVGVKQQIADLTAQFNTGAIGLQTFNKKVTDLLAKNGVTAKAAGKVGGKAFADAFNAQVSGLRQQAAAIAAVPANLRGIGGAGGAADIRIIRPLDVIRQENSRIAARAERQRERQIRAGERAAKAAEKNAALTQQLAQIHLAPLPGTQSKQAHRLAKSGVQP
jgi:hypothetical protein